MLLTGNKLDAFIRDRDWSGSEWPPERWPAGLRAALGVMVCAEQPMALWWGPELIHFHNDAGSEMIPGEARAGALGRPARAVFARDWAGIGPRVALAMGAPGGEPSDASAPAPDLPLTTADGACRLLSFDPIPGEGGAVAGLLVRFIGAPPTFHSAIDDAPADPAMESSLRMRMLNLLENLRDMFIAVDSEWRVTHINAACEKACGVKRADCLGRNGWELFASLAGGPLEAEFRKAMAERRPAQEQEFHAPDDSWRELRAHPLHGGGLAIFVRDITRRKRAEEAGARARAEIQLERARLEAVLDAIPVGVFICDARGGVTLANHMAVEGIWGGKPGVREISDGARYKAWWVDSGEPVKPEEWASARALLTGEPELGQHLEIERFDGGRRFVINSAAPIRDAAGEVAGCVVALQDISELRRAEDALRSSELRLRLALDAAQLGIWEWNIAENRAIWSDLVFKIAGLSRSDFTGDPSPFHDLIHPQDKQAVRATEEAIQLGRPIKSEFRIIRPDGELRWIASYGRAERDPFGRPVRGVGTIADITEAKRVEEALRASESRLRLSLAAARMVAWEWEPATDRLVTTENAADILGLPPESGLDRAEAGLALIHPDDLARQETLIRDAVGARSGFHSRFRVVCPGTRQALWVEGHARVVKEPGRRTRVVGVARDITNQTLVEKARDAVNERLQAELAGMRRLQDLSVRLIREGDEAIVFDEIMDAAIFVTGSEAGILQIIDPADERLELLAHRNLPPEFVNHFARAGVGSEPAPGAPNPARERISVPDLWADAEFLSKPAGALHRAAGLRASQTTPLASRSGLPLGMITTYWSRPHRPAERELRLLDLLARQASDLIERLRAETDLRRTERELREISHSLEERVEQRTAELQERTTLLRSLAAELVTAEQRERKRLAAMLHDDLQQLLLAAKMSLANTRRQMGDTESGAAVAQAGEWIGEAMRAARDLTRQLRPPALYEDGLAPALHWLAAEMKDRHRLEVEVVIADPAQTLADDGKALLFECARELLFNVVKHSGVARARVELARTGDRLSLTIGDEGRGFDPKEAGAAANRRGFGLFSIHERLVALGGGMRLESQPGAGARVVLEIDIESEEAKPQAPPREPDERKAGRRKRERAAAGDALIGTLVVDDHALVRRGIAQLIADDPRLEVVGEAVDGLDALEMIQRRRPDVVLMDFNMPRMNGVEATREIRRRWPEIAVVGLSVQVDDATMNSMLDAGAAAFISKSSGAELMIQAILDAVARRRGG